MYRMEINLYSDTQTKPSKGMYEAMVSAEVGDEQHGLDPTVNALCERVADICGKESALFLPTGTMCDQIALTVHCRPGDEIIAHETAHVVVLEGAGAAVFASSFVRPLPGSQGQFDADDVYSAIHSRSRYKPRTSLVVIEQTANLAGGTVWPLGKIHRVSHIAREHNLGVHIDGARLFNAVVASGVSAAEYSKHADTVWIDLTKGLGCPFGAVLVGTKSFIDEARVWKQRFGGAMRQGGVMAGAGIFALDNNIDRLRDDHQNAKRLSELVSEHPKIDTSEFPVQSNIVIFRIKSSEVSAAELVAKCLEGGVRVGAIEHNLVRAVTHLDVDQRDIERASKVIHNALSC